MIALIVLPAILLYPFNGDNDIYQAMGSVLYYYHGLPYLASWDHNFPGIVLLHALTIAWFGNSDLGFRSVEYLWQIATLFALYRLSRSWVSEESGLLACLVFALYYINGHSPVMGERDGFAILPLALASIAIVIAHRAQALPKRLLFAAGASYGIAAALRPTFALLMLVALIALFNLRTIRGRQAWGNTLLGFAIVVLLFTIPYLFYPHGLEEAWNSAVRFNLDVYTPMAARATAASWFNRDPAISYALIAGWAVSMILYRKKGWRALAGAVPAREKWFLGASFVALLFSILIMQSLLGYQFSPYYAFFTPVLAMLAVDWKTRLGRGGAIGFWALILAFAIGMYPWRLAIPYLQHGMNLHAAYRAENSNSDWGYKPVGEVADYLLQKTSRNDAVEITSSMANLRWRVERPTATRFTTDQPLLNHTPAGTFTEYQKRWRKEYIDNLISTRPKFIVLAYDYEEVREIPGVNKLLQNSYALDTILNHWFLYKRTE
ncbi:MAG TPA: glycosyltransferase family 39 protein [Candidatus Kapabacteria bacterium]|nr:glycosyltransferase family 39 protein [Candidatus Kapabacteria bacterium]